jgi:hypothetical protein
LIAQKDHSPSFAIIHGAGEQIFALPHLDGSSKEVSDTFKPTNTTYDQVEEIIGSLGSQRPVKVF